MKKLPDPVNSILNKPEIDSAEALKNDQAHFSCMGTGCVGWLIIVIIIAAIIILYRRFF